VFPDDLPRFSFKGVYVTCSPVSADKDQVISDKRVAVEACLVPVLLDVVAPPLLTSLSIECVEVAGARADEYEVPGDRRCGPDSAAGFKLPQNPGGRRLGQALGSPDQ
jgi:hypothetical protein